MSAMRIRLPAISCVLLSGICLASIASAQTSWWRTFGGTNYDWARSVQQTSDGGYIIAGYTTSFGAGFYLIKTSDSGDTLWTRTHGGPYADMGFSVRQTSDGGYVLAGYTNSFGAGGLDVYLIKTDSSGDTLWTRTCGGTDIDEAHSVRQTSDGGYVAAGGTQSFGAGNWDVYLVKTDSSGDTLWTRTYGGTSDDDAWSVQQTSDGGYVIAGYTASFGAGREDVYVIKTNASGDTLWTRTYGGTSDDEGYSVQQTSDGGYIIAGYTSSLGAGSEDVYLIKTDASGDTLWIRTYGGTSDDEGYSVQQTSDGGYVIAGYTSSFGAEFCDSYLVKTDASGDTLWTRTHGGTDNDYSWSVQQTSDDGYVTAGETESFGAGNYDVYLIKTDSLGNVGVAEESPKPPVMRGRLGTTVLSGASGVRRLASSVVYDAMGRRVQHPMPGIYFLRPSATAVPRKILLVE